MGKPNPKPQQVHFHGNYPSPDNSPQDVDNSCHLCDSTSTTDSLDESSTLSAPDDHSHFNYTRPLALKSNLFLSLNDISTMPTIQKQMFFLNTMTMNGPY